MHTFYNHILDRISLLWAAEQFAEVAVTDHLTSLPIPEVILTLTSIFVRSANSLEDCDSCDLLVFFQERRFAGMAWTPSSKVSPMATAVL